MSRTSAGKGGHWLPRARSHGRIGLRPWGLVWKGGFERERWREKHDQVLQEKYGLLYYYYSYENGIDQMNKIVLNIFDLKIKNEY